MPWNNQCTTRNRLRDACVWHSNSLILRGSDTLIETFTSRLTYFSKGPLPNNTSRSGVDGLPEQRLYSAEEIGTSLASTVLIRANSAESSRKIEPASGDYVTCNIVHRQTQQRRRAPSSPSVRQSKASLSYPRSCCSCQIFFFFSDLARLSFVGSSQRRIWPGDVIRGRRLW